MGNTKIVLYDYRLRVVIADQICNLGIYLIVLSCNGIK